MLREHRRAPLRAGAAAAPARAGLLGASRFFCARSASIRASRSAQLRLPRLLVRPRAASPCARPRASFLRCRSLGLALAPVLVSPARLLQLDDRAIRRVLGPSARPCDRARHRPQQRRNRGRPQRIARRRRCRRAAERLDRRRRRRPSPARSRPRGRMNARTNAGVAIGRTGSARSDAASSRRCSSKLCAAWNSPPPTDCR